MNAIEYLKSREWSMGNGQCPDCCGIPLAWYEQEVDRCRELVKIFSGKLIPNLRILGPPGHRDNCPLASAIASLGQEVLWSKDHDTRLPNELWVEELATQWDVYWNWNLKVKKEIEAEYVAAAATLYDPNYTEREKAVV